MPNTFAHTLVRLRQALASRQAESEEDPAITQIRVVSQSTKIGSIVITATAIGPTYYAHPKWTMTSLLSWWTLAQLDGARDVHGGYNGTINGNPAYATVDDVTIGRTRRYITLDGAGDYVDVGNMVEITGATAALSVAARVRLSSLTSSPAVVGRLDGGGNFQFALEITSTGRVIFGLAGAARAQTAEGIIVTGTWYTVTIVFDGAGVGDAGKVQIYINGVSQTLEFPASPTTTLVNNSALSVLIGRRNTGSNELTGDVYDVAIWTTNLSAAQALAHHQDLVGDPGI